MRQEGEGSGRLWHMPKGATHELQAEERRMIMAIRERSPERVMRQVSPDPDFILERAGVTFLSSARSNAYLRLFPHDFLVEEILKDGSVVSLNGSREFKDAEDRRTLWVDLIKSNLSGPHAVTDMQAGLGVDVGAIGYAGIKDAVAVTSQRLSLRGVSREAAESFQHERMFLRPVSYGNGALQPGDLNGNRFTIVVRSPEGNISEKLLEDIRDRGFLNIFGAQRFGNRLIAHRLGRALLRNDVDGALKLYFGEAGPFDVPLYRDVRLALAENYGDWNGMLEIVRHFPFTLRDEMKVIVALREDPKKTRAALGLVKDQVKLWIYAYGSWLVNRHLSRLAASGDMPETIALPLQEQGAPAEYRDFMEQDGTLGYRDALRLFPYVQATSKNFKTRLVPGEFRWKKIPQGWVVRFSLDKGAYATSCLSHAFRLYDAMPVPEWAPKEEVDALREMGDGDLEKIHDRFGKVLMRRDLKIFDEEETS